MKIWRHQTGHKSVISLMVADDKENGTVSPNWWSICQKADTQFSVPRVHCLEERSKAKDVENYQYTSSALKKARLKLFRTTISVDQLSIYGEVLDLCDEYSACQGRTGRLVLVGQSDPFVCANKCEENTYTFDWWSRTRRFILQKYNERVERLSQQNRVIKNCTDAGFWQRLMSDSSSW